MITNHRPSILRRPAREASQKNSENLDREYQREQDYWKIKSNIHAATDERLRRSLYSKPEDQLQNKWELDQVKAAHAREEEARRQREAEEDSLYANAKPTRYVVDTDRPWTTQLVSEQGAEEARKRHQAQVAHENYHMMQSKAHSQHMQSEAEKAKVKQAATTEETFWNYGASSDKWIPPEHRVKSKPMSDHAVRFANRDIPYRWDPTSQKAPSAPAAAPSKLPEMDHPWTWHT